MIPTKHIGNPFAPAYGVAIVVDDLRVPSEFGASTERYVPAWGVVEALRAVRILDAFGLKHGLRTPSPHVYDTSAPVERRSFVVDVPRYWAAGGVDFGAHSCGRYYGATEDEARITVARLLAEEDPKLADGLNFPEPEPAEAPAVGLGDVVQLDGSNERFAYCFAVVSEVRSWGIVASVYTPASPASGEAPIRVEHGAYARVGRARFP